jgi:hypothetical protein
VNSFQFTRSTRLILAYPTSGRRSVPALGFGFDFALVLNHIGPIDSALP